MKGVVCSYHDSSYDMLDEPALLTHRTIHTYHQSSPFVFDFIYHLHLFQKRCIEGSNRAVSAVKYGAYVYVKGGG